MGSSWWMSDFCSNSNFLCVRAFHSCRQECNSFARLSKNASIKLLVQETRTSSSNGVETLRGMVPGTVGNSVQKRSNVSSSRGVKWAVPEIGSSVFQKRINCNGIPKMKLAVSRIQCNAGSAELGGSGFGSLGEIQQQGLQELDTMKKKRKKRTVAGVDQDELLEPLALADSDSLFVELNGVKVHHKLADSSTEDLTSSPDGKGYVFGGEEKFSEKPIQGSQPIGIPAILLHGFGASVFSWDRVLKPLAKLVGSKVVAFDRPAFGLTSRTQLIESGITENGKLPIMNPYSLGFSIAATLSFIDLLQAQKAILIGHSAGCLVAANAYFEAPERIAALILIAPAILAPFAFGKNANANKKQRSNLDDKSSPEDQENPFKKIKMMLFRLWMSISRLVMNMMQAMMEMVKSLYRKLLSAIFRSNIAVMLVRLIMDKYGIEAVRYAWYDNKQITDHVIQGYTKPLKCKGWERALLEYTLAMITDSTSKGKPPLVKRLNEISCPVLVVTGDTDRLVPAWNAERLAKAIPQSKFEVIKNCGHLPQEEKPEEFLAVVQSFLQWAFGTSEKQVLQTVA